MLAASDSVATNEQQRGQERQRRSAVERAGAAGGFFIEQLRSSTIDQEVVQ